MPFELQIFQTLFLFFGESGWTAVDNAGGRETPHVGLVEGKTEPAAGFVFAAVPFKAGGIIPENGYSFGTHM